MTSCTGSARRIWGIWRNLVELRLDTEREVLTFACSGRPWAGVARDGAGGGGRWKSQNRKIVPLSSYVEKPLNSKVIKSFVPDLRSRKCFSCFEIPMFYVYIRIWLWYILNSYQIVIIFIFLYLIFEWDWSLITGWSSRTSYWFCFFYSKGKALFLRKFYVIFDGYSICFSTQKENVKTRQNTKTNGSSVLSVLFLLKMELAPKDSNSLIVNAFEKNS